MPPSLGFIPIISDFESGWLHFCYSNYSCSASYLNKTPEELLDACIEKIENPYKIPVVVLDEEDKGKTYVIFDETVFVVKNKRVYGIDNGYCARAFAANLIDSIEPHIDEIVDDFYCHIYGNVSKETKILKKKLNKLKKLMGYGGINE